MTFQQRDEILDFLDVLRERHAPLLPQFGDAKLLSFMATSASPGRPPAVAVRRLDAVAPDAGALELEVAIDGTLPRVPERRECIAISIADVPAFRGFQVKSHSLVDVAFAARLHRRRGAGTVVSAPQVFTIHHGPRTADFFERIPFGDVEAVAARAPLALVAVGEQANLSPRWVLHHQVRDGALELFQGDALWSETYLNLRRNPREVRVVVDLASGEGWALEGDLEEFHAGEHPYAAERVNACFASAGLRPPTRLTRLRVARAWRVGPDASA